MVVTKELLQSAQVARTKYHLHLDEQRSQAELERKARKRQSQQAEVDQLRKRCKTMESEIQSLFTEADSAADFAESKQSINHTKSNALRRRAKEKDQELAALQKSLNEKEKLLRNI